MRLEDGRAKVAELARGRCIQAVSERRTAVALRRTPRQVRSPATLAALSVAGGRASSGAPTVVSEFC
jgi:hypothetical protein